MINSVYRQLPSKYVEYADIHLYKDKYCSIADCLDSCYSICYEKGAEMPLQRTAQNLSACIGSIHTSIPNLKEIIFNNPLRSGNETYKERFIQLSNGVSSVLPTCYEICEAKTLTSFQDKSFFNLPNTINQISSSATRLTRIHTTGGIHDKNIVGTLSFDKLGVTRDELLKIEIGDCIYEISENAFYGCSNLSSASMSRNTKKIGSGAFSNCGVKNIIMFDRNISEIPDPQNFGGLQITIYCEDGRYNCTTQSAENAILRSAIFSDVHQTLSGTSDFSNYGAMYDLKRSLTMLKNRNIGRLFVCGDIGTNGWGGDGTTKKIAELQQFKNVIENDGSGISVDICGGNHDWNYTTEWTELFGHEKNYYRVEGNQAYVFFSITHLSADGSRDYYTPYDMEWFQNTMSSLSGKRVFVFMHYPMNSGTTEWHYAGVIPQTQMWDGFKSITQTQQILDIAHNHGNCIIFSGHSHYAFEIDDEIGGVNVWESSTSNVKLVHVPSLAYPRNKSRGNINAGYPNKQPSQCYIMEVYSDTVILKCLNTSPLAADQEKGNELTRWSYIFEM